MVTGDFRDSSVALVTGLVDVTDRPHGPCRLSLAQSAPLKFGQKVLTDGFSAADELILGMNAPDVEVGTEVFK